MTPKKILIATSEAVPFSKSGGLADVCGALPKALKQLGHDVRVAMPRYWAVNREKFRLKKIASPMGVPMGNCTVWCEALECKDWGYPVYFIEHENYFGRAGLYDDGTRAFDDNAERFGFFSRACIQLCSDLGFQPDIIHVHDWQTALVPAYLKIWELHNPFFAKTASVLTIHNIAYQGVFPADIYEFLGLGDHNFTEPRLESFGRIHFLKGGIFYADAVTTVSPTHAIEILSNPGASGLAPYLERRHDDISGILNGADYEHWNPARDPLIPAQYTPRDLSGKKTCKLALQKEFMLEENEKVPVIGVTSRFADQKGFHLLAPVIRDIVRNMVVQFVILGSGEKWMEDFFGGLPAEFPGRIGAWIGYNEKKAHLIQAGADFFLMPSLYEPCGLNQIYSMKYGTLPIVRETGGLKDTVRQYNEQDGSGTGFCFNAPEAMALYYTVGWAVSTYYDRPHHMATMQQAAMKTEFSWLDAAERYEKVYEKALLRRSIWS